MQLPLSVFWPHVSQQELKILFHIHFLVHSHKLCPSSEAAYFEVHISTCHSEWLSCPERSSECSTNTPFFYNSTGHECCEPVTCLGAQTDAAVNLLWILLGWVSTFSPLQNLFMNTPGDPLWCAFGSPPVPVLVCKTKYLQALSYAPLTRMKTALLFQKNIFHICEKEIRSGSGPGLFWIPSNSTWVCLTTSLDRSI